MLEMSAPQTVAAVESVTSAKYLNDFLETFGALKNFENNNLLILIDFGRFSFVDQCEFRIQSDFFFYFSANKSS